MPACWETGEGTGHLLYLKETGKDERMLVGNLIIKMVGNKSMVKITNRPLEGVECHSDALQAGLCLSIHVWRQERENLHLIGHNSLLLSFCFLFFCFSFYHKDAHCSSTAC